jgi:hypothetical protein
VDVCQILLKIERKIALSVVVELMAFQRSKVLSVDDDTYPIISCYRDFSLKRHEAYRYSSELMYESIQMKLCCFFLDIFMRPSFVVLDSIKNADCGEVKCCVVASIIGKGLVCRMMAKKKKKTSSKLTQT